MVDLQRGAETFPHKSTEKSLKGMVSRKHGNDFSSGSFKLLHATWRSKDEDWSLSDKNTEAPHWFSWRNWECSYWTKLFCSELMVTVGIGNPVTDLHSFNLTSTLCSIYVSSRSNWFKDSSQGLNSLLILCFHRCFERAVRTFWSFFSYSKHAFISVKVTHR